MTVDHEVHPAEQRNRELKATKIYLMLRDICEGDQSLVPTFIDQIEADHGTEAGWRLICEATSVREASTATREVVRQIAASRA